MLLILAKSPKFVSLRSNVTEGINKICWYSTLCSR